jgi:tripartite-type tricarboxylate transporter receptor subunit TctC
MTALLANEAQIMMATAPVALAQMKGDRLRALAVASRSPSPLVPGLPTIAESGLPGFEADTWYGLLAPKGTPDAIVRYLNGEVARVLAKPEVKALLAQQGAQPAGGSPEEFLRFIRLEIAKWGSVIQSAGIRPE